MHSKEHAMVVGGSGMLREVTVWLSLQFRSVTLLARDPARLDSVVREAGVSGGSILPVSVDYRDETKLRDTINGALTLNGPVDLLVTWIHSSAPDAPLLIAETTSKISIDHGRITQWYEVLGSAAAEWKVEHEIREDHVRRLKGVNWHRVVLGFVRDEGRSRWLTDHEISAGVIGAIQRGDQSTVVGQLEPWNQRP